MLRERVYSKVEPLLNRAAKFCAEKKFTPNQLTLAGLGLNLFAGWIYASGLLFVAGFILLIAGLGDVLDGPLARLTGKASRFGAFLTSYTKARMESMTLTCSVGVFERAERILILALGSLVPPFFRLSLIVLLLGTHATALQRIWFAKKSLSN